MSGCGAGAAGRLTPRPLSSERGVHTAYHDYGAELVGFAHNALGDPHLAEEVVQEVFLWAWRASGSYDSRRGSLRTWLYAIARNAIVDARRHRVARLVVARPEEAGRENKESGTDSYDLPLARIELHEALDRLSPSTGKRSLRCTSSAGPAPTWPRRSASQPPVPAAGCRRAERGTDL
ncbi:RNA polymerase sigma factor [Streptomyces sp. NPDC091972]|uniref:RNA polymerase sigma factor n=1 Tax=Streptomyces sp. NPDC091972 TaxID=3366007 RepID=UPI00381F1A3B